MGYPTMASPLPLSPPAPPPLPLSPPAPPPLYPAMCPCESYAVSGPPEAAHIAGQYQRIWRGTYEGLYRPFDVFHSEERDLYLFYWPNDEDWEKPPDFWTNNSDANRSS